MNPEAPTLIKKKKKPTKPKNPSPRATHASDLSLFSEADLVFGLGCNSFLVNIIKLQAGCRGESVSMI